MPVEVDGPPRDPIVVRPPFHGHYAVAMTSRRAFGYSVMAKRQQWAALLRGAFMRGWIRLWGGTAGPGLAVERGVWLRHPPGRGWSLESNVYIGRNAILDIWPGATFAVGKGTKIMQFTVVAARESVRIGSGTQIAEFTSVRDADHAVDSGAPMISAQVVSKPVAIADDVWIARGCAILAGAHIESGAVVGANSLVRGKVESQMIVAGSPARPLRSRENGGAGASVGES